MTKTNCLKISSFSKKVFIYILSLMLVTPFVLAEAKPVFPGAIGFGTDTRAAYGAANDPIICIVTNLSHSDTSLSSSIRNGVEIKTGSFRACIDFAPPANTGKIILFEVSGTINATAPPYQYIIDKPYTAIYGQTAPSPGISLRNINLSIKTHDVVVKHLRIRPGDGEGLIYYNRDSISITAGAGDTVNNVIIDHCSTSWSVDEEIQVYNNSPTGSVTNVTIANCLFAEGLKYSIHEGPHSKGPTLSTWTFPTPSNIALLNNIIAHCTDRTPKIAKATNVVVANNLLYNNEWFNTWWGPLDRTSDVNITGNVGLGGPSSGTYVSNYIVTIWKPYNEGVGSNVYLSDNRAGAYVGGSLVWNEIQSSSSDWSHVDIRYGEDPNNFKATSPTITIPGVSYLNSAEVLESTTSNAGARPADRDSVDTRIINDILNGTGKIINSPSDVGGWPNLAVNNRTLIIPSNPHDDDDSDGYTNLEEWLHKLAAEVTGSGFPLLPPTGLKIIE